MREHGLCVFASACIAISCAQADVVNFSGDLGGSTEATGADVTGSLSYVFGGGSSGSVTISLTNSSPAFVGGFLTGFVFNIDSSDSNASASLFSTTNANFLDTGNESAPPFGDFDAGAALGANWTGGGSPNGGVGIGQSATFVFSVTALDAGSLTASSFFNGPNEYDFVARFRGLTGGGSDKVPLVPVIPGPMTPAAFGLGGLMLAKRRR